MRKVRQSGLKQQNRIIKIKRTSDKTAPKRNSNRLSKLEKESQRKGNLTQKR
jgi:hypothetical protein